MYRQYWLRFYTWFLTMEHLGTSTSSLSSLLTSTTIPHKLSLLALGPEMFSSLEELLTSLFDHFSIKREIKYGDQSFATKKGCTTSAPPGRKPTCTSKQSLSSKHICPICEDMTEDQSWSTCTKGHDSVMVYVTRGSIVVVLDSLTHLRTSCGFQRIFLLFTLFSLSTEERDRIPQSHGWKVIVLPSLD